jgi:hypothetical protein
MTDGRNHFTVRHRSKVNEAQPGDEQATWPRDRLQAMDRKFSERLEAAIERGDEHARPSPAQDA